MELAARKLGINYRQLGDGIFLFCCRAAAAFVICLVAFVVVDLCFQALPSIRHTGATFLWSSDWNPVKDSYGALPQIAGTLASSCLAMLLAFPAGVGTAIFLTEDFLPRKVRAPLWCMVELLAAVPSVVYGMWGIFVLIPWLQAPCNVLFDKLSWCPLFATPLCGPGLLPAALVLAVMVLPTIAAFSRDAIRQVPSELAHGSYALGSTRWETIINVVLPSARRGIAAAGMLALGRAMGETMATAMLIGNTSNLSWSVFAPATTISAHLANQFAEASGLQLASLMYLAVILLAMALLLNIFAKCIYRTKTV